MDFKVTMIPPEGRNKYGNYTSAGRTSRIISTYVNNGNGTTTGTTETEEEEKPKKFCTIALSKTNGNFEWDDIVNEAANTDTITAIGFDETKRIPVYIGDISKTPTNTNDIPDNRNWDIKDIPTGMEINVEGNGTSAATITITIKNSFKEANLTKGTIYIPCSVYIGTNESIAPYNPGVNPDTGCL